MTWRFLNTGFHTGQFNMEFDEALVHQMHENPAHPILRVYCWRPYAISIGYNQHESDFNLEKLTNYNIDIVRRPTGGRAILHANELTYSVVIPLEKKSPREMYRYINEGLLGGLKIIGINAGLTGIDDPLSALYKDPASVPCFASSAKSEIKYKNKKLVGSAQRRYGDVILQHGSLLLGPEHLKISEYLAPHINEHRRSIEENLLQHTIDVQSILHRSISFEETADAVKQGFEDALGISFEIEHLASTIEEPIPL
ncbi:MAG: biotin/lipoate A/B protein ligase family protein [Bacteroidota bacterium]